MNPNINYYGIVILLRKLRECGIFTEKELRKIAARIAADNGVEVMFFLWFSSSFSSYLDAVVVVFVLQKGGERIWMKSGW